MSSLDPWVFFLWRQQHWQRRCRRLQFCVFVSLVWFNFCLKNTAACLCGIPWEWVLYQAGEPARWCEVKLFLCSAVVSLGGREGGPARFLKGEAVIIYSTERGSLRLIFYAVPSQNRISEIMFGVSWVSFGKYSVYYNMVIFYCKNKNYEWTVLMVYTFHLIKKNWFEWCGINCSKIDLQKTSGWIVKREEKRCK